MPTIRSDQMNAFQESANTGLRERLCAYLRESYDTDPMSDEELGKFIDDVCARARTEYGFTLQLDLARFVDLAYAFGPGFDEDPELPWAGPVLRDSSRTASERLALVWFEAGRILDKPETPEAQ